MIQQASWIIWNRLNQNLDSERVETRKTISLLAMSRCVEKNKEVVKYYNVRFITESHPWPHDQVLKLILTILVQYRTFLLIIVSKLRRTSNVCTWPLTWRHFPIWSSNPVNETDRANILIIKDFKKTWSQTLGFDSHCPENDCHGNFTDIWCVKIFNSFFKTFQKSSWFIKVKLPIFNKVCES